MNRYVGRSNSPMRVNPAKLPPFLKILTNFCLKTFFRLLPPITDIMSPTIFSQLLLCAVNTAFYSAAIDTSHFFNISTIFAMDGLICILVQTLFYCYLSDLMTAKLFSIGDIFYNSGWYYLPVKQQQIILLPTQKSQEIFRIKAFGLVECSLWTFANVSLNLLLSQPTRFFTILIDFVSLLPADLSSSCLIFHFNAKLQVIHHLII